jgi:hypothetical protein
MKLALMVDAVKRAVLWSMTMLMIRLVESE